MAIKLEENAKLREMIDTLETAKNDLQVGKNNIADILGSPFTGNDKLETTKNTLSSIRSTFVSNLNKKGVSTIANTPFKILAENVGKIEQGNMIVPPWYVPKNVFIEALSTSAKNGIACVSAEKKIYFINGYTAGSGSNNLCYDTVLNATTSKNIPSSFAESALYFYDGYIYKIGGFSGYSAPTAICQKYNILTNSWTEIANMPTARGSACCEMYSNQIHVLYGGEDSSSSQAVRVVEYYNTTLNTWSTKTTIIDSKQLHYFVCAKVNTYKIVVFGLRSSISSHYLSTINYDPVSGTYSYTGEGFDSKTFAVALGSTLYVSDYGYKAGSGKCGVVIFSNSGIKKLTFDKAAVPSYSYFGASVNDRHIYFILNGKITCFIPEL
ncbi:kelch repeat-containing protein [Clostridioides difficile]|uniref:kelch repeat-containing protein n=1 Tax=Clostridioides difficile TaxID=1496 RepID=UPI001430E4E5|nr:kelch repeat-containing protein [Clostridioides difficile]MCK3747778.1 kelch repeat-containing protein [Clostridioides difficile]MCP8397065.1 kelch repeat-containing protein [Clostridioides difficile]MCP8415751.1 kelch repeat-containing protein [Clostridioides difficile]MCP8493779.1 kelch repeat-containing protein [Clostridioides difficile]MCP8656837.1 kelch repeat-containing protein [Clostridioides difficile]